MRILLALLFLLPRVCFAQDFLNFLSNETPSTSIELDGIYLPQSDTENGPDKTEVINSGVTITQKIFNDDTNYLSVGARASKLDLNSDIKVLRDFYNYQGTLSFKRKLPEDKFWLSSVSYGSASDRPFKNGRDGTMNLNYIQKLSPKWFIVGNYSNNRTFLNNVPLPGFFYIHSMTREKAFIIGFPIVYWMTPLCKNWSFRYFGLLPWTHRLRVVYTNWKSMNPYLGIEQTPQNYFRHDRRSRYDRFFWFERKLSLGVESRISKNAKVDLSSGLAFDRQVFEARNFSQSKDFLINLENAYFVSLNIRFNL